MPLARLSNLLWLSGLSRREEVALEASLTVQPPAYDGADLPPPICLVRRETKHGKRWLGLPVMAGIDYLAGLSPLPKIKDERSKGKPIKGVISKTPTPRHAKQALFFEHLYRTAKEAPAAFGEAPTGSGKTVAALDTIRRLGRNALVIVPKKRIAKQWREAIAEHLGVDPAFIGSIEEGNFDYQNKAITVAVVHNLVGRELPEGFADYFGTWVFDEGHNYAAATFSQAMLACNARHRIILTATPERLDGCEDVYTGYFGQPSVIYEGEALAADCRVFNFVWHAPKKNGTAFQRAVNPFRNKPKSVLKKILVTSERRNALLVKLIMRLYDAGRQIIVMGEEVLHLQVLMGMCMEAGMAGDDAGLLVGDYVTEEGKKKKMKEEQHDFVQQHCRVIFATYGMTREALDIPRLDAGIDVMPRADGVQMIGRIRREMPGKPKPLWLTIRDCGIPDFENSTFSRLRGFRDNNVNVIETKWDATKKP